MTKNYQPLPGTDPQQHVTRFTRHTDRLLPPIQEAMLDFDPRVTFCAAVDRKRLSADPQPHLLAAARVPIRSGTQATAATAASSTTAPALAAGRNRKPFLLQTYRRDMGGGNYSLMKDLSAPIMVDGRHWGGLRIGFKISV